MGKNGRPFFPGWAKGKTVDGQCCPSCGWSGTKEDASLAEELLEEPRTEENERIQDQARKAEDARKEEVRKLDELRDDARR